MKAELLQHAVKQRIQKDLVQGYLETRVVGGGYIWALDDYLNSIFPDLKKEDRNILIAACCVGAGLYTAEEVANDVVARIPMKRSRARAAYEGIEVIAPWRFWKKP